MSQENFPVNDSKPLEVGIKQRENLGRVLKLLGNEGQYSSDDPALMKAFLKFTPEQSDAAVEKLAGVLETAKTDKDREIDRKHWLSWIERPQEVSPDKEGAQLDKSLEAKRVEAARLSASVEESKSAVDAARKSLGLPPTAEDPPSVLNSKDQLAKLQAKQEALEKQKEQLVSRQEKERLVRAKNENTFENKVSMLFLQFNR